MRGLRESAEKEAWAQRRGAFRGFLFGAIPSSEPMPPLSPMREKERDRESWGGDGGREGMG